MKGAMPPERIEERIAGKELISDVVRIIGERRRMEGASVGGGSGRSIGEDFLILEIYNRLKSVEKDRMQVRARRAEFRWQILKCRLQVRDAF
jgi:hypothetical protein